ncbi:Tad domain-containing protein [Rhizobium sp. C4]|uniref:Tad domain-containing protein n=1 Tax=Rhizobium sp. C4 TaxID=1349800 RepID=UPI001E3A3B08|nr:Tad domain-containing protein [Rhizobium sp. C4]MCD2174559.1 Tad domain-containing protein [Rhizobium sp. C4]
MPVTRAISVMISATLAQLRRLSAARDGAMGIVGAFTVVILIAVSALALEASLLFVKKGDMQRVADLANLAAAGTSGAIVNGAASPQAVATAQQVATINGYSPNILTTSVTTSPTQGQLLTTTIANPVTLTLGQILTKTGSVSVNALSSASVASGAASGDCLRTLTGALNIFSSAAVNGTGCTVASATYLYYCSNMASKVSAIEIAYSQAAEQYSICYNAQLTPGLSSFTFNKTSTDPLTSDTRIATMKKRLQGMSSWPYTSSFMKPLTPAAVFGGSSLNYTNTTATVSGTKFSSLTAQNATVTFTGAGAADTTCTKPVTITGSVTLSGSTTIVLGSGCYVIQGVLGVSNGAVVNVVPAAGANVTLALQQYIYNGNGSITFGNMLFSTVASINNGNGGNVAFGNGPFYLGGGIYNTTGNVTFGNGPFYFNTGTVNNGSTGTITFGNGPFYFYYCGLLNSNGTVTLGTGDFEFYNASISTFNSSKTTFGKGNMDLYTTPLYIAGAEFTLGGTGDAVNGASSMFFYWSGLQIASGKFTANGTSMGFWYGSFTLSSSSAATITAPTSAAPTYGYQNVFAYLYGANFSIYQGNATDSLSGLVYNPGNDVSLFGQQTSTIPQGGCFAIIAATISIYNGSNAALRACGTGTANTQAVMAN